MPSHQTRQLTTTGVLLGGALVLAFSSAPLRAEETPSTPVALEHSIAAAAPIDSIVDSSGVAPDLKVSDSIAPDVASEISSTENSGETPVAPEMQVGDLPPLTSPATNRVLFQQRRRPVAQASAANKARAWKLVERGTNAIKAGNFSASLSYYQQAAKADPANLYAVGGVADSLLSLGRNAEAERVYRRALVLSPGNANLRKKLASALVPQRKYGEANTLLKNVVAASPRDFASIYQLAQIATWTNRYSEADGYYRRALALQPRNVEAWTAWGESLSFNKDPRAKNAFLGALKIRPNDTRAQLGLGNLYLWSAEYSDAQTIYDRVLAREPRNLTALIGAGDALSFSRRAGAAVPFYQRALAVSRTSSPAQLGLGRALIQSNREKEGLPYIQRVLAGSPRNPEALQLLAAAQAANISSESSALATYQRLLSTQREPADQAETWVRIAQLHERANDWEKAQAAYLKATDLAPHDSEVSLAYAQALITQKQWEDADEVVNAAIRREPSNVRALTLQVVIESKVGSPERASTLANRLLALNLSTPEDALVLANALQTAGNPDGARQVLERLASQNTSDPATALQVATAIRDAGMYDLARPLFQKLLTSQPNNSQARLNLAELLLWQTQYDAAQTQVGILLRNEPGNAEARVLAATIALRRDESSGLLTAETAANAVLATNPRNVGALVLQTQVFSLRQQYSAAVNSAKIAVDAAPSNLEARLALARNLYYARRTPEAITQYRELIRRAPADVSVKLELAKIFLDQNQLADAELIYRDVLALNGSLLPPVAREMGVVLKGYARVNPSLKPLRGEKFYQAARTAARSTPALRRVSATTTIPGASGTTTTPVTNSPAPGNNTTGNSALENNQRAPIENLPPTASTPATSIAPSTANAPTAVLEIPATNLDAMVTINPTPIEPTLNEQIDANVGLGEVRRRQARFDEAIEYFNAALASDSSNVEARIGLARSLRGKNEFLRALAETDRVLTTRETNLDARVLRAQLLADTGQRALAEIELDALFTALPENPTLETYLDLSSAFTELQKYDTAIQLLNLAAEDYPNRVEVQTRLGETYTFAQRWDDALAVWNRLIALDPQDASATLGKARVYNFSARLPQAEESYRNTLELEPSNYAALTELADVLGRQSEYPDAIALYRQAIAANTGDLKTRVELARVLRYDRQFNESETVLNDVIAADPRYAPAYTERSLARSGLGNYETAIADARRALEITPRDTSAELGLAEALSYAQQYTESIKLYEAVLAREPKNEIARIQLAAAYSYAGRFDDAIRTAELAIRDNPQNVDAQIIRADALGRAGRTPEAVAAYQTILNRDRGNLRARTGLAETYAYAQQYDQAILVYDQLLVSDPNNVGYQIAKGRTQGYARRYPAAVSTLRPVVAANPDNLPARFALAEVMTNSGNVALRREAAAQYQSILRTDPQNTDARIGLGRVYSYGGQYKSAERELNEVLRRYPDNRDARFALAESQRFSGKPFDAKENYERVLRTDGNNIGAQAGLLSVRRETAISLTPAFRSFTDTNGVRLRSFSLGALVPTKAGTIGVIGETGRFEDDGDSRRRRALSLLLAKNFGPVQARLLLSRVSYSSAPTKNLYDLLVERRFNARKRLYANIRKLDVIESIGAIDNGITDRQIRVGGEYPIASRFDLAVELIRHAYSDGNNRTSLSPSLYYRVVDGQAQGKPTLRVGIGYQRDNSSRFSPLYYTPQDYSSFALLVDLTKEQGRLRYGISASHPLSDSAGGGGGGTGGPNRPSDTLFGFANYDVSEWIELFVNGGIVRGPNYDSNDFAAGATVRFR